MCTEGSRSVPSNHKNGHNASRSNPGKRESDENRSAAIQTDWTGRSPCPGDGRARQAGGVRGRDRAGGLALFGYFWWKTRALRKRLRENPPGWHVVDGEVIGDPEVNRDVEVIRKVESPDEIRP